MESRNEFFPSPLKSFVPYHFKWLQIRICQLSKCLVDFRGRLFDFWEVYGWFQIRKKDPADWFPEEKNVQKNSWEKQYPALKKILLMTYNAEKNLTLLYVGKKNSYSRGLGKNYYLKITHTLLPYIRPIVKSTIKGVGKKWIWHISKCLPTTKWLARVNQVVLFKTKVLHFKIENTPIKDTSGKRKFKRMLSFLSVDKRKLFAMKLSFEEFNLVSTRRIGALGLFWTNQGSEVSEDTWGTFRTLWSKKSTFLKRSFCIYKGFMDVFYILTSAWKKNHKMCI